MSQTNESGTPVFQPSEAVPAGATTATAPPSAAPSQLDDVVLAAKDAWAIARSAVRDPSGWYGEVAATFDARRTAAAASILALAYVLVFTAFFGRFVAAVAGGVLEMIASAIGSAVQSSGAGELLGLFGIQTGGMASDLTRSLGGSGMGSGAYVGIFFVGLFTVAAMVGVFYGARRLTKTEGDTPSDFLAAGVSLLPVAAAVLVLGAFGIGNFLIAGFFIAVAFSFFSISLAAWFREEKKMQYRSVALSVAAANVALLYLLGVGGNFAGL